MKVYDNYEISECAVSSEYPYEVEQVDDGEARYWTLFGHIDGEGVQAIGDFATRQQAEQVYSRITGQPFADACEEDARLRIMHAGPKLLEALQAIKTWWMSTPTFEEGTDDMPPEIFDAMCASIADATGRTA